MAGIFLPGTSKGGDITGVTAGVGLSGGGSSGDLTVTLDLSELSAVVPTSGDWFGTLDSDDANEQLTTTDALATLFAGDGLAASSAVLGLDLVTNGGLEISSNKLQVATGISQYDVAQFAASVEDDDFLRISTTAVEGLSAAEVAAAIEGSIDAVGTIASGTWEATDVGVAHGGTGASTLTANGVLIGNGTSAISSVAMATKGHILIGDGSGNPQMLGVGSNDQVLVADSGETTGVKWAAVSGSATALDDIATGDGAASLVTTVGNITIDAQANDADVIIKVDDAGAAITAVTFDGSDAGNALFVNDIKLNSDSAVLSLGADDDATLTHDGTTGLTVAANPFEVDSGGNITLDAHTGIFIFQDANTEVLRITEGNSGDVTIKLETNAKDLIFTDNGDATGLTIKDAAAGIVVPGEVMTTKISFTDGDDAITIADSGITTIAKTMTFATDANIVLGDGSNVNISTPLLANADHTTTGITAEMLAGAAIAAFNVVCIHTTTQEVIVADASAYATARAIGIAPAAISDTATGTVLLQGFIRDDTWNWTTGATLYLSETAGAMTETAPTTSGAFDVVVGVALSPDVVYFNPSMDVIEHA